MLRTPVGDGDGRVGVAAFALQRVDVGQALGVERAAQVDFRPALPPFVGVTRPAPDCASVPRRADRDLPGCRPSPRGSGPARPARSGRSRPRRPAGTIVADVRPHRGDHAARWADIRQDSFRGVGRASSLHRLDDLDCRVGRVHSEYGAMAGTRAGCRVAESGPPARWPEKPYGASVRTDCTTPAASQSAPRAWSSRDARDVRCRSSPISTRPWLQPARSVPAVRRLGGGVVRTDDSGRPLRAVGRDAVVYELRMPTGRIVALRCHLRPDPSATCALAERYSALGGDPRSGGVARAARECCPAVSAGSPRGSTSPVPTCAS